MGAPGLIEIVVIGLICLLFVAVPAVILAVMYFNRRQSGQAVRYGRIPCPQCGESIAAEAIKCRFCDARFDNNDIASADEPHSTTDE